jgi:cellobiose phosphorylase
MCNDYGCNICERRDKHTHLKEEVGAKIQYHELFKVTPEPASEYEITRRALEIAVDDLNKEKYLRTIQTGDINDYIDLAAKELAAE